VRRVLRVVGLDPRANDRGSHELTALREIKRRIGVKRSEKAFVIDVFVTTRSREKSVEVADAIAQSYLADQAEARSQAARRASAALTARLEELRHRVKEAETAVEQYRAQKRIVGANGVLVIEQQLSDVNIQLNNARAKTYEARARVEQIERLRRSGAEAGATPEAVQSQTSGLLRAQYADAARQFADLKARVGPRHPAYATTGTASRPSPSDQRRACANLRRGTERSRSRARQRAAAGASP
jgi:polysaccharide biosynthesis transport protein